MTPKPSPIAQTEKTIALVRQHTDECIVFCSFGKDSLAVLDIASKNFRRVVAVFMYFVKGLEHIDKYYRWAKVKYTNVEWEYVPHWNLTYLLRSGMYCTQNNDVKLMKLTDVVKAMRIKYGIEYVMLGMKKSDGMNRRVMLNTYEAEGYIHKGMVYPLAEWRQADVLSYMRQNKLPSPIRYALKASNGVGFNEDCFMWLKENYPEDLAKIITAFPISGRILFEHERKQEKENT